MVRYNGLYFQKYHSVKLFFYFSWSKLYRLIDLFIAEGILSDWFLYCDTAFRISPPLVITDAEIKDSVRIIKKCLDRL